MTKMAVVTGPASAEVLRMLSLEPEGIAYIHKWLKKTNAPMAHRFAASMPGAKRKDVELAIKQAGGKTEEILDRSHFGCTPLDLAIVCDRCETMEELLEMGANPNNKNGLNIESIKRKHIFNTHPIHTAIHFQRHKCLEVLLENSSSVVETYPQDPNETVQHALFKIDGASKCMLDSEKVMEVLLASEEGREAVDVLITCKKVKDASPQTPLLTAIADCASGYVKNNKEHHSAIVRVIKMLLEAGASLVESCTQLPPLQAACQSDVAPKVVSMLIEYGASPNQYNGTTGETCLYSALIDSRRETVYTLIKHDIDVNSMGPNGKRPIDAMCVAECKFGITQFIPEHSEFRIKSTDRHKYASRFSTSDLLSPEELYYKYPYDSANEEIYKRVVSNENSIEPIFNDLVTQGDIEELTGRLVNCSLAEVNAQDKNGHTALHNAVIINDIDMVELLLENGADVNIEDYAQNTPLNHAAKRPNSLEIIEMILARGADVDHRGFDGKTPLFQAAECNKIENVEYLCVSKNAKVDIKEKVDSATTLHVLAQGNNSDILEKLLDTCTSDANILTNFEATPLHFAARTNAKEAATTLINKGACVTMKCLDLQNTPLHVAAACNSLEVAQVLIENGAEIDERNKCQETPLFLAAATGSTSVLNFLLDKEAKVDAKNVHGQTPLYIAVSYEEFEVAHILMEHGADIEARDKNRNETILHISISTGNVDFVSHLLSKGANKEAKDFHGLTPLLRSALIHSPGLTLTLLKHGCDARATLDGNPWPNVVDLMGHNLNTVMLKDIVSLCPRTKKPKLHPSLKSLPRETKEKTLISWKNMFGSKSRC